MIDRPPPRPASPSAIGSARCSSTRTATPGSPATPGARIGVVEAAHGCHVFPDSNAHGGGEQPQWLYTVRFDGTELWGADAEPGVIVSIDAWEPYLEAVTE